jgi:hypothetical protein
LWKRIGEDLRVANFLERRKGEVHVAMKVRIGPVRSARIRGL